MQGRIPFNRKHLIKPGLSKLISKTKASVKDKQMDKELFSKLVTSPVVHNKTNTKKKETVEKKDEVKVGVTGKMGAGAEHKQAALMLPKINDAEKNQTGIVGKIKNKPIDVSRNQTKIGSKVDNKDVKSGNVKEAVKQTRTEQADRNVKSVKMNETSKQNKAVAVKTPVKAPVKDNDIKSAVKTPVSLVDRLSPRRWLPGIPVSDDGENNITIVISYINIGRYSKGKVNYSPRQYEEYMNMFSKVRNPVIAYMSERRDVQKFYAIRKKLPGAKTYVRLTQVNSTWAFALKNEVMKDLKKNKMVPRVPPEYSAAINAKYDFLAKSVKENRFKTKYICWMDMGSLSNITVTKPFLLHPPEHFDETKVAVADVNRKENLTVATIFQNSKVWVSGGVILAKQTAMKKFVGEYVKYSESYATQGYMNTDAQVLYAMNQDRMPVPLQVIPTDRKYPKGKQLVHLMMKDVKSTGKGHLAEMPKGVVAKSAKTV